MSGNTKQILKLLLALGSAGYRLSTPIILFSDCLNESQWIYDHKVAG